jgi:hypothetical protein
MGHIQHSDDHSPPYGDDHSTPEKLQVKYEIYRRLQNALGNDGEMLWMRRFIFEGIRASEAEA